MTWNELIRSSLRLIGQLGPGRTPNQSETIDAIFVLNSMLESWSNQRLAIYHIVRTEHPLTGASSYTLGPTGDFNQARPIRIEAAANLVNGQELPMEVLTAQRWMANRNHEGVYVDNAYPLANVYVMPASTTGSLVLYSWEQLGSLQLADIDTTVVFPPGYGDAIRYNLAERLAPEWGKELRADVLQKAIDSLAVIKSINAPEQELGIDAALTYPRRFDIYSGR